MLKNRAVSAFLVCALVSLPSRATAAEEFAPSVQVPRIAPASSEGEQAIKRFRVPKGFKVELVAAEPLLANPVAFCIDEQGRFYVAETFRLNAGVTDIRGHMSWLEDDLANASVEDRVAMMKKYEGKRLSDYSRNSDRVRLLVDTDHDGQADKATVFADGFNAVAEGLGAGLLARRGDVYYTDIPNLWLLRDTNGDGVADVKKSLHYGYGVRVGFIGHDLHGLRFGPDGKLYFSIGDRGAHIKLANGRTVENHETGAIYRCNPDGSDLEIFAFGLRNPQELAFDRYGNLWTGDNNSDGGDPARWVYAVEGGDSGWHIGWQFINSPNARGPWLAERMCYPQWDGQPAYALPPIANIANGPSGLAYAPGLGLPDQYDEHFFLCDFRGGTSSGVYSFAMKPKGAGFEMIDRSEFLWEVLVTDGDFGYDGCFYITDWVNGWNLPGKGRIYRIYDPVARQQPIVAATKKLVAEGFEQRPLSELAALLAHPDQRVRQEAQFALAAKGEESSETFAAVAAKHDSQLARLHAIWGLGQITSKFKVQGSRFEVQGSKFDATTALLPLLADSDAEVRAQAAKVLGDAKVESAFDSLVRLVSDADARPRFFAAIALGKLGRKEAVAPLLQMLRANNNQDRYLRHAGVMGLIGCTDAASLQALAKDDSSGARLAAVLALRRLAKSEVDAFLQDSDPLIVAEAARAISDLPITGALPQLAALADQPDKLASLPAGADQKPGPRDPILRRVLNANFRLGQAANANALVALANFSSLPDAIRTEALALLSEWAKPSGRDHVTGLWRPLAPRQAEVAATALQPTLPELLRRGSSVVKVAATKASAQLGIKAIAASASELVADLTQPANVRVEALRCLAHLNDPRFPAAAKLALADKDEALRKAAITLQAQSQPDDAAAQLRTVLEKGTLGERQSALATLAALSNSPAADEILGQWMDKLLAGQVAPGLQLDVLDAAAKRPAQPIKDKLTRFDRSRPAADELRSFRECLMGGNDQEGKKVFLEKVEASCVRCHKVNGEGGEVGPDLTGLGARQDRQSILVSLVFPNQQIATGFESVIVTLQNGIAYAGLVKSENDTVLELNSPEDGVLKLNKSDIKSRERGPSAMPEELRQMLTKQDIRNLVEFLAGLK